MSWVTEIRENEILDFIKSREDDFGCQEDYEDWFGFYLKWDEETGEILETLDQYQGEFENCPSEEEYPVVISYINEKGKYRSGDLAIELWDWISIK